MAYSKQIIFSAAFCVALGANAGNSATHLYLNEVSLVADSTAGKIYVSLEP